MHSSRPTGHSRKPLSVLVIVSSTLVVLALTVPPAWASAPATDATSTAKLVRLSPRSISLDSAGLHALYAEGDHRWPVTYAWNDMVRGSGLEAGGRPTTLGYVVLGSIAFALGASLWRWVRWIASIT